MWKKGQALVPTWTAFAVVSLMEKHFDELVDYAFTARVEDDLDAIARRRDARRRSGCTRSTSATTTLPGLKRLVEENLDEIDAAEINTFPIGLDPDGDEVVVKPGRYGPVRQARRRHRQRARRPGARRADPRQGRSSCSPRRSPTSRSASSTGCPVFAKNGRYGPYVQWGDADDLPPGLDKPKMSSLFKTMTLERITVDDAEALLSLPRTLGVDPADGEPIVANNGRYGPYVQKGKDYRNLDNEEQLLTITLDEALRDLRPAEGVPPRRPEHGRQGPAARVRHRPGERAAGRRQGRPVRRLRHRRRDQRVDRQGRPASRRCRPERAYELLAVRREQVAAKGGAGDARSAKAPAQEGAGAKKAAGPQDGGQEAAVERADAMPAAPRYIALEGAEGCGKSTQAALLAAALGAVLTRETGGTAIGERLRAILHDVDVDDLDDRAEALLTAADRAQHIAEVVAPALAAGRHVVSDRSVYSTLAYQGYGRGLDLDELRRINDWAHRRAVARPRRAARRAGRRARRHGCAGASSTASSGRRRVPRAGRRRLPGDGRGRPGRGGSSSTPPATATRSPPRVRRRGRPIGWRAVSRACGTASSASRRPSSDCVAAAAAPGARLPVRRAAGLDQGRGGPGVRRRAAGRRDDPDGRDARLALAGEHPDVREVERAGRVISAEQADEIVRLAVAGAGRGRAQGARSSTSSTCCGPRARRCC